MHVSETFSFDRIELKSVTLESLAFWWEIQTWHLPLWELRSSWALRFSNMKDTIPSQTFGMSSSTSINWKLSNIHCLLSLTNLLFHNLCNVVKDWISFERCNIVVLCVLCRSIGCILYELATLEHAFPATTLMGVMYKIVEMPAPQWPSKYSTDLGDLYRM